MSANNRRGSGWRRAFFLLFRRLFLRLFRRHADRVATEEINNQPAAMLFVREIPDASPEAVVAVLIDERKRLGLLRLSGVLARHEEISRPLRAVGDAVREERIAMAGLAPLERGVL